MKSGYYWIKKTKASEWEVAYYSASDEWWFLIDSVTGYSTCELHKVDKNPILRKAE